MSKEYTRNISIIGAGETPVGLLYSDEFEDLLKWTKFQGIGDAIFELDPTIALRGSQSLRMKTRTVDTAIGDYIYASIKVFMIPSQRIVAVIHFRLPSITTPEYVEFQIQTFDGAKVHSSAIFYYPNTPIWKYLNSVGAEINIPDSAINLNINTWHRLTLYLDFVNDKYISAYINNLILNVSNISFAEDVSLEHPFSEIILKTETAGANPVDIHFDYISLLEA